MKKLALTIVPIAVLAACIPKVRLTVETRSGQGTVIERADITNSDSSGREFRVSGGGSITLTAWAETSDGLSMLNLEGGYNCSTTDGETSTAQQGTFNASDPNLPGQNPTTTSFQRQFGIPCASGRLTGSARACATSAKRSRSCTPYATFK